MATVSKRRNRFGLREFPVNQAPEDEGTLDAAIDQAASRPRRSLWKWLSAGAVVLLVVLWLVPTIVAHSPLLNSLLGSVAADLNGTLTARSATLSWFTPARLSGLDIRDEQGQTILEIPEVRTERSLWALLWNSTDLGRIRVERPTLNLVLREDGSNVEDVLASYLTPREESPTAPGLVLEIVDGTLSISDARAPGAAGAPGEAGSRWSTWRVEGFQLTLKLPADGTGPLELQTSGTIADQKRPGSFSVKLKMPRAVAGDRARAASSSNADAKTPAVLQELAVQTEDLPLAMLTPVFDRAAVKVRLAGRLSSAIACRSSAPSFFDAMAVEGTATVEDLVLVADFLGPDQVEMNRAQVACKVARHAERVDVDRLDVESDAASARITGTFALDKETAENVLAWLPAQTFHLEGRLDLARLAAMLPGTLRIREGTKVTSGQFEVSAAGEPGSQGMRWRARIEASNLAAVNQGRQVVWQQPVLIHLAAHETAQGPVVESLKCDSNFLKLHAAGTPDQLDASASFDLNQLAGQLGQFVDLGNMRLAGDGWAQFNWERSEAKDFQADGELQLRNFELALDDQPLAAEESLILSLAATGRTDFTPDTQVSTARLTLNAGSERVEARLAQPVLDLRGAAWPLEVRSTGELARVLPRLRPWIAMDNWNLAGSYELVAKAIGSKTAVDIRQARLTATELEIHGPGWDVVEPQAELTAAGVWDGNRRRLELGSATLSTSGLSAQASNIVSMLPAEGPPELSGTLTYRGSLDRLRQWMADPENPSPWRTLGQFTGTAEVRHAAGATTATFDTTLRDLVATHASGRQIHEAEIRLSGRGSYQPESRSVVVEKASLISSTLAVSAGGQVALGDGQTDLQLNGQVDYDMERITALLVPYLGQGVRLAGRGSNPVSYRGPLDLDAAQAQARLSWMRAEAYGFLVGPGELEARLSGGTLDLRPTELDVSEGHVRLATQVRLAPEPMELYVEPGRVAEQVRINPRMCASALQYVAPILAGVATAEGHFSIELERCRIPLSNPAQGELSGRLIIHSAQVGPGPLVEEMALLLGRASPAQLSRESVISFRMADGRIYHRDLEFVFPDLVVRTHGSVGLDQSLKIIAEMPIPPKWRGTDALVNSALRNQTIRVPIGGTLSKPRIDQKALERLSRRFLKKAARNVLEDGLNQGLQQLFGPPR